MRKKTQASGGLPVAGEEKNTRKNSTEETWSQKQVGVKGKQNYWGKNGNELRKKGNLTPAPVRHISTGREANGGLSESLRSKRKETKNLLTLEPSDEERGFFLLER